MLGRWYKPGSIKCLSRNTTGGGNRIMLPSYRFQYLWNTKFWPYRIIIYVYVCVQIIVHDSLETLYEHVPKDMLPDVYGGTGGNAEKFKRELSIIILLFSRTSNHNTSPWQVCYEFLIKYFIYCYGLLLRETARMYTIHYRY